MSVCKFLANTLKFYTNQEWYNIIWKLFATLILVLSLWYGKTGLSFFQSSSPNFDKRVVQKKVIEDRELNSIKKNDQLTKSTILNY